MQSRELKLLIGLLVAVFYGVFGESTGEFLMGTVWNAEQKLDDTKIDLDNLETEEIDEIRKLGKMNKWKRQSLPPSPEKATLVYKEWLHDLAEVALEFKNVKVTPERMSAKRKMAFVGIQIKVVAEGNVDQVRQFLYRFYQADLMHRIVSLGLESQQNQGDPVLEMTLTAEGLSLPDAAASVQNSLFARTRLSDSVDADSTSWKVVGADEFQRKPPFRVRIGKEYVNVTGTDGNAWTISRAVDSSSRTKHEKGTTIELAPVKDEMQSSTLEEFASLVELNPFAKPAKYEPKLEITGTRAIARNEKLALEVKATGFDPKQGKAVLTIQDVADELKELSFDPRTGKVSWTPGDDVALGEYKFTLKASSDATPEPIVETVAITLRNLNTAPVIEKVGDQTAIIGQELAISVKAADKDEPANKLTFALPEGSPAGSSIDPNTGALKWTPDVSSQPGRVELTVNVTDDGNPPMTASIKIPVDLLDDAAQFTHLTGIFEADDDRQARFYDRSNDKYLVVREGETLKYAGIEGFVMAIGRDFILMQIKNQTYRLELGKHLRDIRKVENQKPKNVQTSSPKVPMPAAGP